MRRPRRGPRARPSRSALILTGGGFSGALFEIGGLVAFDEILRPDWSATSFDIYVGSSAGSVVASLLALGLPPAELRRIVLGESALHPPLRAEDIFRAEPPLRVVRSALRHLLRTVRALRRRRMPITPASLFYFLREDLPSGAMSIEPLRATVSGLIRRLGRRDELAGLGRELYITAFDLDTGARVVFGDEEHRNVPISAAVAASCAIPGLFAPVTVGGARYIDGGVGELIHTDVALRAGAETVVVLNPFVPVVNDRQAVCFEGRDGLCVSLGDKGLLYVIEQARRISRKAKLEQEVQSAREDDAARLFVVEPESRTANAFLQSPVSTRFGAELLELGYETARRYFSTHREELRESVLGHPSSPQLPPEKTARVSD